MFARLWLELLECFGFDSYRDSPEHTRDMRTAWAKAAQQLGLRHTVGANTFSDRIDGQLEGYNIEVTYIADFDVQKPVTLIFVRSALQVDSQPILYSKTLLAMYDQNAGPHGPLIPEERAWLCGARYGAGIVGNQFELIYRQLWQMYDAADIVFVCSAMVKLIRYLDPNRTNVQR